MTTETRKTNLKVIILMGVTGAGKSTVGQMLGDELSWTYYDSDDFHPPANIEKIAEGISLTDEDRQPWLETLQKLIHSHIERQIPAIIRCSALKKSYRDYLRLNNPTLQFVYLHGEPALIRKRLANRIGHFMKGNLIQSQFDALEPPIDALTIDANVAPADIVQMIRENLRV